MNGDLLQTKLNIPLRRPNLVPRTRLVERLDAGKHVGGKFSLICAPAGFGKTTLAADWVHSREQAVAWLSLDEDDNDPVRFLTYVIAALRKLANGRDQDGWSELGLEPLRVLQSAQKPPLNVVLTGLINQIAAISEPVMLVLDDYHLIQTRSIHQAVAFLLDNQPPNFHLAMTTREDPPIPLSRMRARQELTEIRLADLRFSGDETAILLNQIMGLDLSAAQIEALEHRTEGWISGLQLAALSMRGSEDVDQFVRSFAGSNRYILDYLMEQVFEQQPPEIQTFLLHTSVLDQLCAPLCDAVLDDAAAHAELASPRLPTDYPRQPIGARTTGKRQLVYHPARRKASMVSLSSPLCGPASPPAVPLAHRCRNPAPSGGGMVRRARPGGQGNPPLSCCRSLGRSRAAHGE